MPALLVFGAGMLFAVGLALSGMTQPQKVIGFLDVTGDWDPDLAFVMGGALLTYAPAFRWVTRRKSPVFASLFRIPTRRDITPSLVVGASLFGIGWGLSGLCPGPALASITTGAPMILVFLGAMIAGMTAHRLIDQLRASTATAADTGATPTT